MEHKVLPTGRQSAKQTPSGKQAKRDMPQTGNPENTILISDTILEIKPMDGGAVYATGKVIYVTDAAVDVKTVFTCEVE